MDEYAEAVYAGLAEKTITAEELAKRSVAELELASVLVDLVGQAKADVKYGWVKALRLLVDEEPELLYAHFATFAGMLHSENNIFQWEALHLLASLAAVDDENTLEAVLDDSFAPIEGQIMITAANGIKSAAQIVRARLGMPVASHGTSSARKTVAASPLSATRSFAGTPSRPSTRSTDGFPTPSF